MCPIPHRYDRIYPLRDAAAYPGADFLDMVFFLPLQELPPCRLWLRTEAPTPMVGLNERRFVPVGRSAEDAAWVDLGVVEDLPDLLGSSFGQLKIYGVSPALAQDSLFVVTPRTDLELHGDEAEAERLLHGIARREAGRSALAPASVTAGTPQVFTLFYEAGPAGLPEGARLRLSFPGAFATPQTDDPAGDGFLEIRRADRSATILEIDRSVESHEKTDLLLALPEGLPPAGQIEIRYRTDFTYIFADTFASMERRYWWSRMPPLAPAVSVDGARPFVPPEEEAGHALRILPGRAERLLLWLPGRRGEEETDLSLVGVACDRYRNIPPRGEVRMGWRLELTGPDGTVDLGTTERHIVARHRFEAPLPRLRPGVYRARAVDPASGACVATSNPLEILPAGSDAPRIYWGEIHGHCGMSDGGGDFYEMYRHARDEGRLDFAASGDHACYFSDNQWLWMQDITNGFNHPGRFVTLVGYEWAGEQGHRNVYTAADRLELFRGMTPATRRLDAVYDHFRGREEVVAGPHTEHTKDFFDRHDPDVQRFLEIYSMWGSSEEKARSILAGGARIGFTGGGDCHEGHCALSAEDREGQGTTPHGFAKCIFYKCGITGTHLPALDRDRLVHALRERRTYATTGARILLDVAVGDLPMGADGETSEPPTVRAAVHGCAPLARVEVIRNGETAHALEPGEEDVTFAWTDAALPAGETAWYYLRVIQTDGETAWSSPIWLTGR